MQHEGRREDPQAIEGWRRMDCRANVMSPRGLLAPYWLVGEEERPMAISQCAVEAEAGFHQVRGPVHSLT